MQSYRSTNGRNRKLLRPVSPSSQRSPVSDGLLSLGSVNGYERIMPKSTDRRNLRLLIDKNDPHFPGLKRLKFRGKELSTLPPEVFNLKELELLDLSPEREACLYFKLPALPATISKLVNLKVLILDTNELTNIPPEIGTLSQLEHLTLSNNCLTQLPNEITLLENLSSLHIANNHFTIFPEQVFQLTSVTFLDVSDNKIETIPPEINKLQQLETLILFSNQLRRLPNELCELTELRMLWLGDNQIRVLPRNFGKLKFLDWDWHYTSTTLDGNPIEHPPMEICRRGMKAIDKYLQDNWSKIERGESVYTPSRLGQTGVHSDDYESQSNASSVEYGNTLNVDPRMLRNMRRGSIPIPSSVRDGLAALDRE